MRSPARRAGRCCFAGGTTTLWKTKKYIKVLQPTKNCRLGLSELLVYSYYAYQDAFDTSPGTMEVVRGVGLSKGTVRRAKERLEQRQLHTDTVQPPGDLFYPAARKNGTHWRDNYAYWHYYVRSPDSFLTTLQVAVLSFLWHLRHTKPGFRLSISFMALSLCAKRDSISSALDVLQAKGFLTYQTKRTKRGGVKVAIRPLTLQDMDHFQDVGVDGDMEQIALSGEEATDPLKLLRVELTRICSEDDRLIPRLERAVANSQAWATNSTRVLRDCHRMSAGFQGVFDVVGAIKNEWCYTAG